MKTCLDCGERKPLDAFYHAKTGGVMRPLSFCKICHNRRCQERRRTNPAYRMKQRAARTAWGQKNRQRRAAHVKACKRRKWIPETAPALMHECAAAIDLIFQLTHQRRE